MSVGKALAWDAAQIETISQQESGDHFRKMVQVAAVFVFFSFPGSAREGTVSDAPPPFPGLREMRDQRPKFRRSRTFVADRPASQRVPRQGRRGLETSEIGPGSGAHDGFANPGECISRPDKNLVAIFTEADKCRQHNSRQLAIQPRDFMNRASIEEI